MFGKRLCLSDQQMGFSLLCNVIDVTSTMQTEMFIPILGVLAGNTCMKVCIYPKVMGSSVTFSTHCSRCIFQLATSVISNLCQVHST